MSAQPNGGKQPNSLEQNLSPLAICLICVGIAVAVVAFPWIMTTAEHANDASARPIYESISKEIDSPTPKPTQTPQSATIPQIATPMTAEPVEDTTSILQASKGWHWHEESDYAIAEGTVKNIGNEPLKNVEAVVSYMDKSGGFITTADALIEFNPILPGQTSPWKAMVTYNPAMASAKVEFKDLMGGSISSKE